MAEKQEPFVSFVGVVHKDPLSYSDVYLCGKGLMLSGGEKLYVPHNHAQNTVQSGCFSQVKMAMTG